MNQEQFIKLHENTWDQLEKLISEKTPDNTQEFPQLYRKTCHHLGLAKSRLYSPLLIKRLNKLAIDAHQILYTKKSNILQKILRYAAADFPRAVRKEAKLVYLAAAIFYIPLITVTITLQYKPELAYTLMSSHQLQMMESMYDPKQDRLGRERDSQSDALMFGYYIYNNTSIGFQTFSSGLLFAVGTLIILLLNGLLIGAAAGHLTQIGYTETFWSFVVGHSSMELTAIVLSGAAGLKIGFALLRPKQQKRLDALRDAATASIKIMSGAAIMFFIAAFIEAFWSSIAWLNPQTKYIVGGILWALVIAYFVCLGRKEKYANRIH